MSKRRGIWEDGLDLNTLWADITNTCRQSGITVNYSQLSDPEYLNGILIQLSDISSVPLSCGPKTNEDLRQFIDTVLETMELKERKRRAKRRRVILVVSRESGSGDLEYPKLLMIMMHDVSFDIFESAEIDTEDERVEIDNGSGETVERKNNIANDSEDVADILEQLQIDTGDEEVYINEIFGTNNISAETVERENNIPNDSDDFADFLEQLRRLRH
jgi:hypothetical protein